MNSEKWLIAVTAGRWQKHGISEAKAAGLKVLAIDGDQNAEGFQIADRSLHADLQDTAAVIKALKKSGLRFRGAVSFCSEAGMTLASIIREEFDLPGVRPELCERLLNKGLQRELWSRANVPGPTFKVFVNKEEVKGAIISGEFPVILKPTDSSGSRGVTKIESANEDLDDAISRAFEFSRTGSVILESFMNGTEFTVEVFAYNGKIDVLAITEKKKVEGTKGTVASELATSPRPEKTLNAIADAVISAFKALGYSEGPGHAEVILMEDDKVGLVEVAGRGGGFMVFDKFVPGVSGVNIARLTALQSVGLPINPFDVKRDAAVLRFFPSRPGRLVSFSGFDDANKIGGVEAAAFVEPGQTFSKASADGDRMGYILAKAGTPALAQQLADRAEQLIHFEINSAN